MAQKTCLQSDSVTRTLALAEFVVDPAVQSREAIDADTVARYVEDMKNGDQFPPLKVCEDIDGKKWLYSGFHTHRAYVALGKHEAVVEVIAGDKNQAILLSAGENHGHGQPRSTADKHRAVTMLLDHPVWGAWSSRKIADHAKVAHTFVDKLRGLREGKVTDKRLGRDGKVRPMPTSKATQSQAVTQTEVSEALDVEDASRAAITEPASQLASMPVGTRVPATNGVKSTEIAVPASQLATLPVASQPPMANADEKTHETANVTVCDAYHRPAPPHLVEVFRHMPEYKKLIVILSRVYNRLDELVHLPAKSGVHIHISSVNKEMTAVKDAISSGMPRAVCPQCDGLAPNPDADVCTLCEGRGWLPEYRMVSLPRRQREYAESFRPAKLPAATTDDVDSF